MQFLKTLFWVIAAIILAAFAHGNWSPVTISLWAGLVLETKLPLVVLGSILVGFLPPYAMLRATRWRARRRLQEIGRSSTAPEPFPPETSAPPSPTLSEP
jgi:putative membrane protein